VGVDGVIRIETSVAVVTVRVAEAFCASRLILIVTVPGTRVLTIPELWAVLLTVATDPLLELQCPDVVMS